MALPVSHYLRVYRIRQGMAHDGITQPTASGRAFFDRLVTRLEALDQNLPVHLVHEPAPDGGEWVAFLVGGQEQARILVGPNDDQIHEA
jgi:hypothetical protein